MSEYEELRDRCFAKFAERLRAATDRPPGGTMDGIEAALAEVYRTLETVTPKIDERGYESWLATLRTSPLKAPEPKP